MSPAGRRARLTVLIFHRVLPAPDVLFPGVPDASRFETEMRWIKAWFNVLPLGEAVQRMRNCELPARAAAITFDDGYADNFTIAMPILRRLRLTATFFVASGYLNGGRMWNDVIIDAVRNVRGDEIDLSKFGLGRHAVVTREDRRAAIEYILADLKYVNPEDRDQLAKQIAANERSSPSGALMLTSDQLRAMCDSGMTIGAHTVTHPILARIDESAARAEMSESKRQIEAIINREVNLFAYPNGKPSIDYMLEHVRLAHEVGFSAAMSTGWGAASADCDPYQIPRFTPWDRSRLRYALRLASNFGAAVSLAR